MTKKFDAVLIILKTFLVSLVSVVEVFLPSWQKVTHARYATGADSD
jgi:hypothetical protein